MTTYKNSFGNVGLGNILIMIGVTIGTGGLVVMGIGYPNLGSLINAVGVTMIVLGTNI